MRIISVRSGEKGTGMLSTVSKDRTMSPASMSSARESAISVTTKPLSTRRCARLPDERCC